MLERRSSKGFPLHFSLATSKLEHSTTHQINIKNQKKEMTTTNIIREKKWNRLHHLRGMSRARSAEIKNQGESNFAPPSYAESILYETEKVTPTKQNSSPSRPKSADSIFNKRKLPSPSFSFTDTHPRVYSANRALEFEDRLHREEIEYQQELVEYMAKKFQQTEKEKKLLNMIRKSYEKNPCVNYKIYQQKQDENRQKRQQRRVEHYQKWKIMNQQFEEYSKQEEENYQKNINNNINKTKISNIETV